MKLNYNVKFNNVFYPHGTEIPKECEIALFGDSVTNDKEPEVDVIPVVEDIKPEIKIEPVKKYKKTDINRLSVAELKDLAKQNGIEDNDYSGTELKKILIEKLV